MSQKNEVVKDDLQYVLDLVKTANIDVPTTGKEVQLLLDKIENVCKRSIRVLEG